MVEIRPDNRGLTVKVNLWPPDKCAERFGVHDTRLWIRGVVTHGDSGEPKHFNSPEELVVILNEWNIAKWGIE
jgi:hypothetical protein